ncbi:hypothetical protein [Saccharospirillum salsuginis]|uniref:Rhombotail lipoprotein n=1 Tax=Saccharospirillum salsuginis TaxID=418750 RepID=A0A918N751_9GAMM|nr:hypothetical protein [Saccharospirillum salsuginis]GGX46232.1 hypothetical protein GCM10007392_11620 [Saccharospirillum salsuginis]
MNSLRTALTILIAAILAGCASHGFDQGYLNDELAVAGLDQTEEDIQRIMDLKPALGRPFSLGIYYEDYYGIHAKKAKGIIMDNLIPMLQQFKDAGILEDYFIINNGTVRENNLKEVRIAAARHHADAILMIDYYRDSDRYLNPLGITYLTIVAGYFIPGSEVEAIGAISATMWDTRNEYLYATSYNDELFHTRGPAFMLNNNDIELTALEKAVPGFMRDLSSRLANMFVEPDSGFEPGLGYLEEKGTEEAEK